MKLRTQVGLGPGHIVLDGDPIAPAPKGQSPSNFRPYLLWPNGWIDQDGTWDGGRPHPRRLCVRWRPSPLPKKGSEPRPQFSSHVCGQTAVLIKIPLGTEVGLSPGDFVLDGDHSHPKKGWSHPLQFSVHVYCGQMTGWIKMALGVEDVGLGPGHIVLDGDPAHPPKKGAEPHPIFGPFLGDRL